MQLQFLAFYTAMHRSFQVSRTFNAARAAFTRTSSIITLRSHLTTSVALSHTARPRLFSTDSSSSSASSTAPPPPPARPIQEVYRGPPTLNALLKKFNLLVHPDLFGEAPEHQKVNLESLQTLNSLLSTLKTKDSDEQYPIRQRIQLIFYVKKRHNDEAYFRYLRGDDLAPQNQNKKAGGRKAAPQKRVGLAARSSAVASGAVDLHGNTMGAKQGRVAPKRGDVVHGEFHAVPVQLTTTGGMCKQLIASQLQSMFIRCGLDARDFKWDAEYWQLGGPQEFNKKEPVYDDVDEYEEEEEHQYGKRR